MALEATHVAVAGNGNVYVAPEGTALPADLVTPLPAAWLDVGYIGEDGVQFTLSRDTEDILAWQSADPIRVLTTSEPKTIEFELLEWDRVSIELAFRGGTWTGTAPYTYTPPAAGVSDVRAMVIDGIDGATRMRFAFPRVQLTGDVEFALQRTDASRFSMEFGVLASATPWKLIGDMPGFAAGALMSAGQLSTHADLDAAAESVGHTWSADGLTVKEKQEELDAAAATPVAG